MFDLILNFVGLITAIIILSIMLEGVFFSFSYYVFKVWVLFKRVKINDFLDLVVISENLVIETVKFILLAIVNIVTLNSFSYFYFDTKSIIENPYDNEDKKRKFIYKKYFDFIEVDYSDISD